MNIRYDGKVAVVTGGTRGIGRSIAELLHDSGADVIVTGTSQHAPNELPSYLRYEQLDVQYDESLSRFVSAVASMKRIDVLVNNAGINIIERIDEVSMANFTKVLDVNLKGPFVLIQAAINVMKRNGGRVLNIGSIWSRVTRQGRTSYIVSKSALDGLTRAAATDAAEWNILVNTLSPGFVDTDLTRKSLNEAQIRELQEKIPIGRLADPAEIAWLAAFLCSERNTYLTGQNIIIDGGFVNV